MGIIILSLRPEFWERHLPAMQERGFQVHRLSAYEEAAETIRLEKNGAARIRLVVIDLPYNWGILRKSVVNVVRMDDKINVALVTSLPEAAVLEEVKGLGLMLAMPQHPSDDVVKLLLNNLQNVISGKRVIVRDTLE